MTRLQILTERYGADRSIGVRWDASGGLSLLPDGGVASNCYHCASYIREREPSTVIFGFFSDDNPAWVGADLLDGHDFALVEGRYIVDPWIVETARLASRAVFDTESEDDAAEISRIYGRSDRWVLVDPPSKGDAIR